MGLEKEINYKGFSANYWVITSKSWNKIGNKTNVTLNCFKDKATRELGLINSVGRSKSYCLSGDLTIAECYTQIKAGNFSNIKLNDSEKDFFKDAIDC